MVAPFLYPPGGKGDTNLPYWLSSVIGIVVLAGGVGWWFGWRILRPWVGGWRWEERKERLRDGTVVVTFRKVKGA